MKKLSLMAALTLSTILSACGGGGGGHGYLPPSIPGGNPDQPVVSCTGVTCMTNEGLSNKEKRRKLYDASQKVTLNSSKIKLLKATNDDPIETAYDEMKDFLTASDLDTSDVNKLRQYLILAGFEDLPSNNDELKTWAITNQNMIKDHAQKSHDMYAKEGLVYLDNAKLQLISDGEIQDSYINFTLDNTRSETFSISGIQIIEDETGEAVTNKLHYEGGNNFKGDKADNKMYQYGFVLDGLRMVVETTSSNLTVDDIKKMFVAKVNQFITVEKDSYIIANEDKILKYIDEIPDINFFDKSMTEDVILDKDKNHGFYNEIDREFTATYTSHAKDMQLAYSDFGILKLTENQTNHGLDKEVQLDSSRIFAGGYDAMKIDPLSVNSSMHFEGKAIAGINHAQFVATNEDDVRNSNSINVSGKATLDFVDGKETLTANFSDWYDVTASKDLKNGDNRIDFKNGEKIENEIYKFNGQNDLNINNFIGETYDEKTLEGTAGVMNMGYYGKDNNPSEATGYIMYRKEVRDKIDNDLLNSLEVQIGVGMQRK